MAIRTTRALRHTRLTIRSLSPLGRRGWGPMTQCAKGSPRNDSLNRSRVSFLIDPDLPNCAEVQVASICILDEGFDSR